ncbi:MAG: hypothetical protein ACJ75B_01145 [Flavisolibacter sp.]
MKKLSIHHFIFVISGAILMSGCYKLQKDYQYQPSVLDPHINMSAKDYLLLRGTNGANNDTVFKWMQLGIEYAGIDLSEYEKPNRTYIFLHNNAIRTVSSGNVSSGFFYDYPAVVKDSTGSPIKSKLNPSLDSMKAANSWSDYPKELVKNYFLYLILQGDYGFENLSVNNTSIQTLLPPGTVASVHDSRLGWVVTRTTPNPDAASAANINFSSTGGSGFDPEGKINLKLVNNQNAPINVNDRADDRSAGYFATNGQIHVYDKTIHPFRYSY